MTANGETAKTTMLVAIGRFLLNNILGGVVVWLVVWIVLFTLERVFGSTTYLGQFVDFWDSAPPDILVATFAAFITWSIQLLNVLRRAERAATFLENTFPALQRSTSKDMKEALTAFLSGPAQAVVENSVLGIVASRGVAARWATSGLAELARTFVDVLTEEQDELAPALAILARRRLTDLKEDLERLTSDAVDLEVLGRVQVDICSAFAVSAQKSITFVDRAEYDLPQTRWSARFKTYLQELNGQTIKKTQYLIIPQGTSVTDAKVTAYKQALEQVGFLVILVQADDLKNESGKNVIMHRTEVFDETCFVQIVRKPQFDEVGNVSITVKRVADDKVTREMMLCLGDLSSHASASP